MNNTIEIHPIPPFLPPNARILILGSFPPTKDKWSMDFFYPNFNNDMWRIIGEVFFNDKNHFLLDNRHFDKAKILKFLNETGIAISDTAHKARRLHGNASDQYLEIIEPLDLDALLRQLPLCRAIATTGEKATSTLLQITNSAKPPIGGFAESDYMGRRLRHYRMPSSSRAYPKPLAEKVALYAGMFRETGIL